MVGSSVYSQLYGKENITESELKEYDLQIFGGIQILWKRGYFLSQWGLFYAAQVHPCGWTGLGGQVSRHAPWN